MRIEHGAVGSEAQLSSVKAFGSRAEAAAFVAKQKALPWRASPSFFLDFSARNWRA